MDSIIVQCVKGLLAVGDKIEVTVSLRHVGCLRNNVDDVQIALKKTKLIKSVDDMGNTEMLV